MMKRVFNVYGMDWPIDWGYKGSDYLSLTVATRTKHYKNDEHYRITVERIERKGK